jgi:hypothetical protein
MSTFRYAVHGNWYKGNAHIHSVASDGGKTFDELSRMYCAAGYDFLFRTDHWVASDVTTDQADYPLLWLDGIELDGSDSSGAYYHVVCLGTDGTAARMLERERGFVGALEAAREQGALLILAHPYWTGNSLEDSLRWGFDGVEVYNHICHWLNGKGSGGVHWNWLLQREPRTLGLAVDDAHIRPEHPGWNGGWIMVNALNCTRAAILEALRRGAFYSTQGPEFRRIESEDGRVCVETSPVRFLRLVGPAYEGARIGSYDGGTFSQATIEVPPDWAYAYLEIEDTQGRCAWTNALYVPEQ